MEGDPVRPSGSWHIFEEAEIRAVVNELDALSSVEVAFRAMHEGRVEQPSPIGLEVREAGGEVHIKTAHVAGMPVFVIKIGTGFYRNTERGIPSSSGLVLVFDAATGHPVGVLRDNAYLTEMRTAAAGALALRSLAPQQFDTLGILGTGIQARYQIKAMARVRRWERTIVWGRSAERCRNYCREMQRVLPGPFFIARSREEAVKRADVLLTVTPSREPLVEASWLKCHATIIAVGSDSPKKHELESKVIAIADKVIADSLTQCLELGEIHHALDDELFLPASLHAELGEIIAGTKAGRQGDELIVCDLTGLGAQDTAIGGFAWQKLNASEATS